MGASNMDASLISISSNPPKIQNFSFPENISFYISNNPSTTEIYEKLIKMCKYFYIKNPIITMNDLWFRDLTNEWKTLEIFGFKKEEYGTIINPLPKRLWLNKNLSVHGNSVDPINPKKYLASFLISKIIRNDITLLNIFGQNLTFNEFKLLVSSKKLVYLIFSKTIVKSDDGRKIVPIENLIENLPNLRTLSYNNIDGEDRVRCITSKTAKKISTIPHFSNIKNFYLKNIPETFEFETFFDNLKKPWTMDIELRFNASISDNYKQRLQKFVDNLIATGRLTDNRPPDICFEGMTDESCEQLEQLENAYKEKY